MAKANQVLQAPSADPLRRAILAEMDEVQESLADLRAQMSEAAPVLLQARVLLTLHALGGKLGKLADELAQPELPFGE